MSSYKIQLVEGIDKATAKKFIEAGVATSEQLLDTCASPAGRKSFAEKTGVSEQQILTWTNHADLIRIKGVGPHFAELLEAAGVDTVKEFKMRNAANLYTKMEEVNKEKKLCGRLPTQAQLQKMIDQASKMPPKMTY
ncbi:hypothetical protein M9Y10_020705 [Tritrichomonas musculus]|uniref:DUF4332 domain-containing protein n=1 Tax=Tritrichomonas musculus TaxID=1915356 RepID=A0ABR2HEE8_9EUKA